MLYAINQTTFDTEVLGSTTPVLVNFWAPWCSLCRLVGPMVSELQDNWGNQIKMVNVNADENFSLANAYRLTTLPTIILFSQGDILCRLENFRSREDFRVAANDVELALKTVAQQYSYSVSV
jgi:thioredoxin 1